MTRRARWLLSRAHARRLAHRGVVSRVDPRTGALIVARGRAWVVLYPLAGAGGWVRVTVGGWERLGPCSAADAAGVS